MVLNWQIWKMHRKWVLMIIFYLIPQPSISIMILKNWMLISLKVTDWWDFDLDASSKDFDIQYKYLSPGYLSGGRVPCCYDTMTEEEFHEIGKRKKNSGFEGTIRCYMDKIMGIFGLPFRYRWNNSFLSVLYVSWRYRWFLTIR